MRGGVAQRMFRRTSPTVPPLIVAVVGAAACAVLVILAVARAPWWVMACAAAGFVVGFIPALIEQYRRRTRIVRRNSGHPRVLRNRPYIVPRESPAATPDFHGRDEELSKLYDFFIFGQAERTRTALIVGAAGVGKTALTIQFATTYGWLFPGGQLFARLDHPTGQGTPEFTVVGRFLGALGTLGEELPGDLEGRLDLYSSLTVNWRGLVILDDACHALCVTNLLPSGRNCATIITSRDDLDGLQGHRIVLQPLHEGDAVGLLESVIGEKRIQEDPQSAKKIAGSGHPLSVRLAGEALANRPYLPLKQAVTRMDEQAPLPDETSTAVLEGKLDLSYALLTNEERIVLRCIGLLAQSVVSPWELAALLGVGEADAIRLADSLSQAQLVRRTSGGRAGVVRFEVHEHVLEYALARMRAETKKGERRDRLAALARARDARMRRANDLAWRLNADIPAWKDEGRLDKALDEARDALSIAQESGRTREVALALATLGDIQLELGNTDEAWEMAQATRSIDDQQPQARALRCMGKVMRRMRKLDLAQQYLADAMTAARETNDIAEQIRTLVEQSAVLALVEQGTAPAPEIAQSVALADKAISLCQERGHHSSLITAALWARGNALMNCGQAPEALAVLNRAAHTASDDQALWRTWVSWLRAKAALETGHLTDAADFASEAIDSFGTMAHRFGIAHCKLVLGRLCLAESRLNEAITLLTDALRIFQNCNDLWTEADAKRTLATALLKADRRSEAVHLLQDAARDFKNLGDETSLAAVSSDLVRFRPNIHKLRSGIMEPQQSGSRKGY